MPLIIQTIAGNGVGGSCPGEGVAVGSSAFIPFVVFLYVLCALKLQATSAGLSSPSGVTTGPYPLSLDLTCDMKS